MTSDKPFQAEIDEFEKQHQDQSELIRALAAEGLACCMKYSFDKGFAFTSRAYELAKENPELISEILPMHIVAVYLHDSKNDQAIKEFKAAFKKVDNGAEKWKEAKANLLPLIEGDLKKISYHFKPNFYAQVNPFPEVVEKLKGEEEWKLNILFLYLDLAKKCKSDLSGSTLSALSAASFEKIKTILDMDSTALRTVDEKELARVIALIRDMAKLGEGKNIDAFERELAFKFTLSSFLGKQFDGLMRLSKESFSQSLLAKIKEKGVIEHILANMHQDLAKPFSTVLKKMWGAGGFTLEVLTRFWEVTLEQHSSVIAQFFNVWPVVFSAIPKSKVPDFWNLVLKTECLPTESLAFLRKISEKADDSLKKTLVDKLWEDSQKAEERMEFARAIADYTPSDTEGRKHVKNKCFTLIEEGKGKDVSFAITVLSYVWKCTSAENSRREFGVLIHKEDLGPEELKVCFGLLTRLANTLPGPLTDGEYEALKVLLTPLRTHDTASLAEFLTTFVSQQKNKVLSMKCQENLIGWLAQAPNVDASLVQLIQMLFCSVNNIDQKCPKTTTYDWIGMDAMWELLFNSTVSGISTFLVELFRLCQNPKALADFVTKCCSKLNCFGALTALTELVRKIETPLDLKELDMSRNEFIPQSQYVRICLTGDYSGYVRILRVTDVNMFKAIVARLMNVDEASITLLRDGKGLTSSAWVNDEKIEVAKSMFSKPARTYKKADLPSQILKKPEFFSQIWSMLKSDDARVADFALSLLNLMEPNEEESRCFKSITENSIDWKAKLSLDEPYVLIYRLNMLGNMLTDNNKKYILAFFRTGGFQRLWELIASIKTDTFAQSKHVDILLYLAARLIEPSEAAKDTEELRLEAYRNVGLETITSALMNWVLELNSIGSVNACITLYHLLFLLYYIVGVDKGQWLKHPRFREFFTAVTFSALDVARTNMDRILHLYEPKEIEDVVLENLCHSKNGHCVEYFGLVQSVAKTVDDPKSLFLSLFQALKESLFVWKEELDLENCHGDADLEKFEKELTAKVADFQFVHGVLTVMHQLLDKIKSDEEIPEMADILRFIADEVVFNTSQYIPVMPTGYRLIAGILEKRPDLLDSFVQFLRKLHDTFVCDGSPPGFLSQDVHVRGLQNMGCTCYLNASMQQIFRIQQLRKAVIGYAPDDDVVLAEDWMSQLALLWLKLLYAPCKAIDASKFVRNWKGWDGLPINPREQQDAVEFVQMILDRIDSVLPEKPVSKCVQGTAVHRVEGMTVQFVSERDELFTTFGLEVNGQENFEDSFKAYLVPDTFTGENKYNAEGEFGKIDANIFHSISHAPEVMIFQLKRFDFDLMTAERKKVDSYYQYPVVADISMLLTENRNVTDRDPCEYELCGVVVHSGSAMGGHYYSYVKNELTGEWVCCNDSDARSTTFDSFVRSTLGGIVEVAVWDPAQKEMRLEKRTSTESAYLLFYKKIGREMPDTKCELLTVASQKILSEFRNEICQMLLKSELLDKHYLEMIERISSDSSSPDVYNLLYSWLFKLLGAAGHFDTTETLVGIVTRKLEKDAGFAKFFLEQKDEIIPFLLSSDNIAHRAHLVKLVNAAMKSSPSSAFIDCILTHETLLEYWKHFDHIFQPVQFYVSEIDGNRPDILAQFWSLIEDKILARFGENPKEFESVLQVINLSAVFKTILKLIDGLNKGSEYQSKVIEPEFMLRWFSSAAHTFDVAALVTYFMKDNKERTETYLQYISELPGMREQTLAAHFANACSFNDSLTKSRIMWFLEYAARSKWEFYALASFIRESGRHINSSTACAALLEMKDSWMGQWLLHPQDCVRSACADLIYGLFRSFPRFTTSYSSYPTRPTAPVPDGDEIERKQLRVLFDALLSYEKLLVSRTKELSGKVEQNVKPPLPTPLYFEILTWCVHYGKLESLLAERKGTWVSMLTSLSKIKSEKTPIIDELRFLGSFTLGNGFFDAKTASTVIKAVGKGGESQRYVSEVVTHIFPALMQSAKTCMETISSSKIMKQAIKWCLDISLPCSSIVCDMISLLACNNKALADISPLLFDFSVFKKHHTERNTGYIKLISSLLSMKSNNPVEEFRKNKCVNIVIEYLTGQFRADEPPLVFNCTVSDMELLIQFSLSHVAKFKDKDSLFSKPMKWYIELWKSSKDFWSGTMEMLQQVNTTHAFAVCAIRLMKEILTSDPALIPVGLSLIEHEKVDFYSRLPRDSRKHFAKFTQAILEKTESKQKVLAICARDMERLVSSEIFTPSVFLVYGRLLASYHGGIDLSTVFTWIDKFLVESEDLQAFEICDVALQSAKAAKKDDAVNNWTAKVLEMISSLLPTITCSISEPDAKSVGTKLAAAKKYLSSIEGDVHRIEKCEGLQDVASALAESHKPALEALASQLEFFIEKK